MKLSKLSKRQLLTLAAFSAADFCNAICVSLQAPFFPEEASKKGANATEYGCVFGVFELVVFLISPWYGKNLTFIGPKRMFYCGIFTSGVCSILFGLLDLIQGHLWFISLAFLIRIIEAMGNAAFLTASFAIIANEFPDNVATTFASLETFFGLGLIAGPSLGGVLYQIGGYITPFVALGVLLFLTAVLAYLALPSSDEILTNTKASGKLLEILQVKGIPVCAATILSTSTSISFFQTTLEPHLYKYHLTPIILGLVFVVTGLTYGASAPAWGWLCDKYLRPKTISIIGGLVLIVGVALVGPAPYVPIRESLMLVIIGLFLHGLGIGARLVSAFTDAMQTAIASGLTNDLETYGLVSGLWTSSFALGAFIGPTVSGYLYDEYGFSNASVFIIVLVFIMVIFEVVSVFCNSPSRTLNSCKNESSLEGLLDTDKTPVCQPVDNHSYREKLCPSPYQNTIGIGSSRALNLMYNSETDLLEDEDTPLLLDTGA